MCGVALNRVSVSCYVLYHNNDILSSHGIAAVKLQLEQAYGRFVKDVRLHWTASAPHQGMCLILL